MMAEDDPMSAPLARLHRIFHEAQQRFLIETNNAEVAWEFSRACFDLAYAVPENSERAEFATNGIAAAQRAIAFSPNSAAAHYYLGMNIGQLADTKRNLSGLHMVKDIEREFLATHALDEHFDYAGADRNLGLLYEDAPSFISIGSRTKARRHLERALELAPEFPDNHLNLLEAYLKWDYRNEAAREWDDLQKMWPGAQKKFAGEEWTISWLDWNKRLGFVRKRLGNNSKVIESPHSATP
jgi:tetratricopeptide (TPR) repeat protein